MYRFLFKLHPAWRPQKVSTLANASKKADRVTEASTLALFSYAQKHASMYTLIQVVALLVFPVLFVLGNAEESPFLFTGILQFGCGIGAYAVTLIFNSDNKTREGLLASPPVINMDKGISLTKSEKGLFTSEVRKEIWSLSTLNLMLISMIGNCMLVLFAWGLLFMNVSTAVILYEIRTLLLSFTLRVPFMSTYDKVRNESRQRREANLHEQSLFFRTLIFCVLPIAGVVLVILSNDDTPQPVLAILAVFDNLENLLGGTLLGVVFVLMAAAFWALQRICATKLAKRLCDKHPNRVDAEMYEKETKYLYWRMSSISLVIAGVVLCVIGLAIDLVASEFNSFSLHQLFYAIMGALVYTIGAVAKEVPRRYLNSADAHNRHQRDVAAVVASGEREMGVKVVYAAQAFQFVTPLGILILLWMLSILDVSHLDYLIIGTMGITVSSMLTSDDNSSRRSYQALIVSLWLFGTITYFTEGFVTEVPLELPITVFILVLAFRVARLVRRTSQEEEWVLDVFHRLKLLASKEPNQDVRRLLEGASQELIGIDRHKSVGDLIGSYKTMVSYLTIIDSSIARRNERDADQVKDALHEITDCRRLVDMLVHSRQQGSRFDEVVAMALTGGLLVLGLLVFNGRNEFYSEFTSFLLSSIVVFLFFNIVDLEKDRNDETIIAHETSVDDGFGNFIVNFESAGSREKQQVTSVVNSVVIVAGFLLLFTGVFELL